MTATSEASRYQQLRDHLGYLRLDHAAEALPAVLDHAKTDKLSVTATLEQLLRIEVDATETRRLAGRLRIRTCPPQRPWKTSTTTPNPASTPT